jgi:hypothetical protein
MSPFSKKVCWSLTGAGGICFALAMSVTVVLLVTAGESAEQDFEILPRPGLICANATTVNSEGRHHVSASLQREPWPVSTTMCVSLAVGGAPLDMWQCSEAFVVRAWFDVTLAKDAPATLVVGLSSCDGTLPANETIMGTFRDGYLRITPTQYRVRLGLGATFSAVSFFCFLLGCVGLRFGYGVGFE